MSIFYEHGTNSSIVLGIKKHSTDYNLFINNVSEDFKLDKNNNISAFQSEFEDKNNSVINWKTNIPKIALFLYTLFPRYSCSGVTLVSFPDSFLKENELELTEDNTVAHLNIKHYEIKICEKLKVIEDYTFSSLKQKRNCFSFDVTSIWSYIKNNQMEVKSFWKGQNNKLIKKLSFVFKGYSQEKTYKVLFENLIS